MASYALRDEYRNSLLPRRWAVATGKLRATFEWLIIQLRSFGGAGVRSKCRIPLLPTIVTTLAKTLVLIKLD